MNAQNGHGYQAPQPMAHAAKIAGRNVDSDSRDSPAILSEQSADPMNHTGGGTMGRSAPAYTQRAPDPVAVIHPHLAELADQVAELTRRIGVVEAGRDIVEYQRDGALAELEKVTQERDEARLAATRLAVEAETPVAPEEELLSWHDLFREFVGRGTSFAVIFTAILIAQCTLAGITDTWDRWEVILKWETGGIGAFLVSNGVKDGLSRFGSGK